MKLKRTILSFIVVIGIIPINALAQDSVAQYAESLLFQTIRTNHEESYITFGQGLGNMEPLIFEAKIAPYYLIRTSKHAKWGATLSPKIVIRMFAEESFPVRTPSYMPNITFYRQLSNNIHTNNKVHYLYLMVSHHSNGQNSEFYNADGTINTYSGNFSTNFIEFGTFFNRRLKVVNNAGEFYQTSIEIHPDIHRSEELEGRYSFIRWHNSFSVFRFPNDWKFSKLNTNSRVQTRVKTTWLFGETDNAELFDFNERFNFSVTINYRPKVLRDVSLFANYYTGKDYYNMQFNRRINVFRIGLQAYSFK
jgi:hypothetical protein